MQTIIRAIFSKNFVEGSESVVPLTAMNGAQELNRVVFDNVPVPVTNRIGEEVMVWLGSYLFERAQTIYGGSTEIQKNIIWKTLFA